MEVKKFAAIDIGSNAVRLLLMNVIEENNTAVLKKSSLVRMPLRLGEDVFLRKRISDKKAEKLCQLMLAFKNLISANDVVSFKACATSAMREAENNQEIVKLIKEKTGITIEIIDGREEAEIIYTSKLGDFFDLNQNYLFVDVGGGSTEITLISNHQALVSNSFNIGTIRLLNNQVPEETMLELKSWLKEIAQKYGNLKIIGSGGNINKIFKLSHKKEEQPLSFAELKGLNNYLESFTMDERIKILGLNPDRADVIIPACKLFIKMMKWSKAPEIYVPKMGLSDGIVYQLYKNYKEQQH